MKKLSLLMLFLFTSSAFAQMITVKEKVRLSLWFQGLKQERTEAPAPAAAKAPRLPEEIERPLRHLL